MLTFLRDGGPGLAALITVLGVLGTIFFTNRGNKVRLKHEEKMKELELEAAEKARLRDERIAAYKKILSATSIYPGEVESLQEMMQVLGEIQLVAGTKEVSHAANDIYDAYSASRGQIAASKADPTEKTVRESKEGVVHLRQCRTRFLKLARKELRVDD